MKAIEPGRVKDNFIEIIGKEWMLVSAGDKDKFNMMTASWGGVGFLWNKPVVFVFIRPERYTREFVDAKGAFTLSFLGEEHKAAHKICGSKSGREIDKVAATGLTPCFTDLGNPCFEESRLTLECKTLYVTKMDKDHFVDPALYEKWYSAMAGNPHNVYVAEILNAWRDNLPALLKVRGRTHAGYPVQPIPSSRSICCVCVRKYFVSW